MAIDIPHYVARFSHRALIRGPMSHYWQLQGWGWGWGHLLHKIEMFENFVEHYCPFSGQFWGSLEAKRGQNAKCCAPMKILIILKSMSRMIMDILHYFDI